MKNFSGFVCVLLLLSTTMLWASERPVTLQLTWKHQFQFAGYYAAIEQGYYKDAGFDVTLVESKPGLHPIDEVISGNAEYGVGRAEVVLQRMHGVPVTVLATIFQHSAIIFLSRAESGIMVPADLIGRRVMLLDGVGSAEYLAVMNQNSIPENEIIRLPSSYDINDLIDGNTDVFNAYSTNEPFSLIEKNIPYNIIRPLDYGIDFYGDVLFTSEAEIARHPDQVKAFRLASLQGWHYAMEHPEEIIELLLSKYGVQKSKAHLEFEAEATRELIMPEIVELGYVNPDRWQKIADVFSMLGMAPESYTLEGYIYDPNQPVAPTEKMSLFSKAEQAYLKEKKVIWMCNNPYWAPIEFAEDGDLNNMQGIAIETLKILEKKMGVTFENVPTGGWPESQQFLKEKKCDILPCAVRTNQREEYANFTKPYLNLPLAIFMTRDKKVVSGLDEIMDKPWTRQKGSGLIATLREEYPEMTVIETRNNQEALQYVNSGKSYFTIATHPVASHVISKYILTDLHVAGYTGMVYDLCIAVRDDDEMLLSVLNKALADISKEEARTNIRKWVSESVKEPVTDYKLLGRILTVVFVVVLFFAYRQNVLKMNIAKLKKAENQINTEKERLIVTLRSIGDGVITTDLDGGIVLINKISEKLTGWTQQEAEGRSIQEVFTVYHERTGKRCENPVEKVLALGQAVELTSHSLLIAKDGSRYLIEDSAAPIFDKESNIIGVVLVYRDVTEERKTKEELIKAKKLESVGVLAGGIAHDFNNILAAILGNIEMAGMSLDKRSEAYSLLQQAQKASLRAKGLTQQLLTFAKGGDPVKKTSSISTIITDSANFVLHGSSVICSYKMPEDLWKVDIDAGQISQVIQNIIINGRQAMPDGGVIEVGCENISDIHKETLTLPDQKYIKITISDSGSGIPEKYLGRIFDPYFSTKQEGSGLGLAICHAIVHKHDGNILVESVANEGTTFSIFLPASKVIEESREPNASSDAKEDYTATIMVMDDDDMVLKMARKMLTRSGHEVLLAEDGTKAIKLYGEYFKNNRPIDLIIMDLTIPGGMGGRDAVLEILKINPEAKVVVASGYSNDPVMAHCQDYGFKGSIAKPYQLTELKDVVDSVLL